MPVYEVEREMEGGEVIKRKVGLKEFLNMLLTASDRELRAVELTNEGKEQFKRGVSIISEGFSKVGSTFAEAAGALRQIGDALKKERGK